MLSIAWFLALGTIFPQTSTPDAEIGPLMHYQRAATALQSDKPLEAISDLENLLRKSPNSSLAPLAAIRLAECYLSSERQSDALQLLLNWTPRVLELDEQHVARKLDRALIERATHLTKSALAKLPESRIELLEQFVKRIPVGMSSTPFDGQPTDNLEGNKLADNNFVDNDSAGSSKSISSTSYELSPVDTWLLIELAKRFADNQRYSESYQLLVLLGKHAGPYEQELRDHDIPLAILLTQPTTELIGILTRDFVNSPDHSVAEFVSFNLAVAEAQRHLGDLTSATATLERLASRLNQPQASSDAEQPLERADWCATVDLRLAELLVMQADYRKAISLTEQCLTKYTSYPGILQFRFLAARCFIADIEFDRAREQLQSIISDSVDQPENLVQAMWTLGEISFLQKNYPSAIEQYAQVLKINDQPKWHARALLQTAKCHELQSSPLDAFAAYQTIVAQYPQSEVVGLAQARLEQLAVGTGSTSASQSTNSLSIQR